MNPSDREYLSKRIGIIFLDNMAGNVWCALFYGITTPMYIAAATSLLKRKRGTFAMRMTLAAVIFGLACSTIIFVARWVFSMYQISLESTHNPDKPVLKRRDGSAYLNVFVYIDLPSNWAIDVSPIVTDAVVVWRAWMICKGNRRRGVLWFLLMLWFSTSVMILIVNVMQSDPDIQEKVLLHDIGLATFLYACCIALSIATNFLATFLIGWKLWEHRNFLRRNLRNNSDTKRYGAFRVCKILFLLVETGFIYCVIQAINIGTSLSSFPYLSVSSIVSDLFGELYVTVSCLYPTILVLMVQGPFRGHDTITMMREHEQDKVASSNSFSLITTDSESSTSLQRYIVRRPL